MPTHPLALVGLPRVLGFCIVGFVDRIADIIIWFSISFGSAAISNIVAYGVLDLVGLLELKHMFDSKVWWLLFNFIGSALFFFLLFRYFFEVASHTSASNQTNSIHKLNAK